MIILRDYDKDKRIDRVWYESSSILYSECEDVKDNFKVLRVVFKNGSQYQYKDVDVNDYVMFVHGGLDGSNGKALNTFIKKKCEYTKLDNINLDELNLLKEEIQAKQLKEKENENTEQSTE